MNGEDKNLVRSMLVLGGDDFWRDDNGENAHLFDEIVEILNRTGLDLKLVPIEVKKEATDVSV